MDISLEQLDILRHSLGLNGHGRGRMYRNHYVAGGEDAEKCRELVKLGLMGEYKAGELSGRDPVFCVTAEGMKVARNDERKTP